MDVIVYRKKGKIVSSPIFYNHYTRQSEAGGYDISYIMKTADWFTIFKENDRKGLTNF